MKDYRLDPEVAAGLYRIEKIRQCRMRAGEFEDEEEERRYKEKLYDQLNDAYYSCF